MEYDLIQPWSVLVMKTSLPSNVLQTMIEISDVIIADKEAASAGDLLVGQIEKELIIEQDILSKTGVMNFFLGAARHFVALCKCQMLPDTIEAIELEEWEAQIDTPPWIVSQQPGEYNPMHTHGKCTISSVMYLKIPKMLPPIKEHRSTDDGSILFVSNASRDNDFSVPNIVIPPAAGDFFIFGAQQQHAVYPYRCEEGDPERRSISFNAVFQSKSDFDIQQAKEKGNHHDQL